MFKYNKFFIKFANDQIINLSPNLQKLKQTINKK